MVVAGMGTLLAAAAAGVAVAVAAAIVAELVVEEGGVQSLCPCHKHSKVLMASC